jgi:hypothetical protein
MTIVTSVKVRDGLVLGTDSMTQIVGTVGNQTVFIKAYRNAHKLFDLSPALAGAMTYGLGNVGQHSIEGLVREFRPEIAPGWTIEQITQHLFEFVEPRWREAAGPTPDPEVHALGFCVAGYSPGGAFAEVCEFVLPRDTGPTVASGPDDFGVLWRGVDTPLLRLIKGWDPRLLAAMQEAGLSDQQIESMIGPIEWFLSQPGMPLQDAVNLVDYLLSTTMGLSTFVEPNPTCGGPLQVATVLPDRGFTWMSQPELHLPYKENMT